MPYFYGPSLRSKTSRLSKSKLPYLNEEGLKAIVPEREKEGNMRELFERLTANMKKAYVEHPYFAYIDPCTGEDVYMDERIYYYESSLEDFVKSTKEAQIPSGICDDVKIVNFGTSTTIWVDDCIALDLDRFNRRAVIYDYDSIEDKHLYALINLVRKEVSVPSR